MVVLKTFALQFFFERKSLEILDLPVFFFQSFPNSWLNCSMIIYQRVLQNKNNHSKPKHPIIDVFLIPLAFKGNPSLLIVFSWRFSGRP